MKDFIGQELAIGNRVAFTAPQYRHLCQGTIKAFTPTKVRVEYINTWNFGKGNTRTTEYLSEPDFLIRIFV